MSQQTHQTHKWSHDYLVASEYRDPITGIALKKTSLLGELVYILHSGMMFNREGEWITPPFPSSRTDEFKASVSYILDEAFQLLHQAITSIESIPCAEAHMIDICSSQTTTVRDDVFFTVECRLSSVFYANGKNDESYRNWITGAANYHGLLNNTASPTSTVIISKPSIGFHYIALREDGFTIQPCCYEDIHVKSRNRS
tara:strand:+ start:87 stop:683 length:597 start_codon:yes stop_codon:yes gene_type:complete